MTDCDRKSVTYVTSASSIIIYARYNVLKRQTMVGSPFFISYSYYMSENICETLFCSSRQHTVVITTVLRVDDVALFPKKEPISSILMLDD